MYARLDRNSKAKTSPRTAPASRGTGRAIRRAGCASVLCIGAAADAWGFVRDCRTRGFVAGVACRDATSTMPIRSDPSAEADARIRILRPILTGASALMHANGSSGAAPCLAAVVRGRCLGALARRRTSASTDARTAAPRKKWSRVALACDMQKIDRFTLQFHRPDPVPSPLAIRAAPLVRTGRMHPPPWSESA